MYNARRKIEDLNRRLDDNNKDLNRRLDDNNEDLSALQARIGILENILQRRLTMPSPTMNITGR